VVCSSFFFNLFSFNSMFICFLRNPFLHDQSDRNLEVAFEVAYIKPFDRSSLFFSWKKEERYHSSIKIHNAEVLKSSWHEKHVLPWVEFNTELTRPEWFLPVESMGARIVRPYSGFAICRFSHHTWYSFISSGWNQFSRANRFSTFGTIICD
jgi:hypothetical protein